MTAIPTTTILPRTGSGTYTLRPGVSRDIPGFARAYYASFSDPRPGAPDDNLLAVLFGPDFRSHPAAVEAALALVLGPRLWSLHYRLSALVDSSRPDDVLGFVCIKRPDSEVTFYERWLSPRTWLNTLYAGLHTLATVLWHRGDGVLDAQRAASFSRAFVDMEPRVRCSPRRRAAWYLSIVAVQPTLQGRGLGAGVLEAALAHIEAVGARQPLKTPNDDGAGEAEDGGKEEGAEVQMGGPAVWLTARKGTEGLYRKFGFVKVMESNTGPLSAWNGGAVMFRGLQGVKDRP